MMIACPRPQWSWSRPIHLLYLCQCSQFRGDGAWYFQIYITCELVLFIWAWYHRVSTDTTGHLVNISLWHWHLGFHITGLVPLNPSLRAVQDKSIFPMVRMMPITHGAVGPEASIILTEVRFSFLGSCRQVPWRSWSELYIMCNRCMRDSLKLFF